ncbi:MAG: hypothetical protein IPH72_11720 [Sandaracinaceae bacterium]|nr:hypothetical protein [Sandaracinaceae bacterium]
MDYDSAYGQLPVAERIAVHQNPSAPYCTLVDAPFCMVQTTATWDRGFAVLNTSTDPNQETTVTGYDGLARLTQITLPSSDHCDMGHVPVQTFQYEVALDQGPVSRITAHHNHGNEDCSAPAYIETVSYVDGLGRVRAALTRRSENEWERSGVTVFNARGTQSLAYQNDT